MPVNLVYWNFNATVTFTRFHNAVSSSAEHEMDEKIAGNDQKSQVKENTL